MSITLQKVEPTIDDGSLILLWRNDETTRKMSFNTDIKIWDEFKDVFFKKYFNNYISPLFAYYNDKKIHKVFDFLYYIS